MKRVFLETYGCQMNLADSELMAGVLEHAGYELVGRPEAADAIIVNTCAIREHAEQRVLGRLGDFKRIKAARPEVVVCVAGCMAQHLRHRLLDGNRVLDLVVGPDGYRHLPDLLRRAAGAPIAQTRPDRDETYGDLEPKRGSGVRAWITIQRGCDKFCTYCVVPFTRGRERSLPLDDLVRQVRGAADAGFQEVVFLGQTVNSYHDGRHDFADLLRAANQVQGLLRIRYTSPHPSDMSDSLIEAMAECDKVCPQVHLPLQSGSDSMLSAMNRSYTIDDYRHCVDRLRSRIPDLALSTDIIVGFVGETQADFEATVRTVREVRYDNAFLFKYSARPDTRAHRWEETVSEGEKGRRLTHLIDVQRAISGELNDAMIGREVEVLVEARARRDHRQLTGKTPHFKTVVLPDDGTPVGGLTRVRIAAATTNTLIAAGAGADAGFEASIDCEAAGPSLSDPALVQIR